MLFRPQTRRRAKPRHQVGIAKESLEPASEPFGVARRCQETGDAVLDQLRDAAHRRGHRRHTAGVRFHQADRHSFAVARKHRRCGPAPPPEDPGLLCRPSQLHGPGKIEPDPRSLEFVATRSVADDSALELYSASPEDRARLQGKLDPFEGNEPGDTHDQRRLRTASVRLEALRIHAAWNDVNAGRGHAEGLDDVPKIRFGDGDDRAGGGRAIREVRWCFLVDVVPVGREGKGNADLGRQVPRLRGGRGGEVRMEQLRLELPQDDRKLARVVYGEVVQAGPSDDFVAHIFGRSSQGQYAHLHAAPAHLGQLARDERLRDLWKDAKHVGHPERRHAFARRARASERARSITSSAFWSQVYRPWISLAAASPRRRRNIGSDSNRSQAAAKASASPAGYSTPVSPSRITSAIWPAAAATTATPQAMYSNSFRG